MSLAVILIASFLLKLQNLSHTAIHTPDEIISAQISRNLMKHPLVPTLVDRPYLPYDDTDWQSAHLWIFKPPMAFWQIAAFFSVFGVKTFVLRLPSAILSTLAVLLTYLIGSRWLGRGAGLVAAALQAFNPAIVSLVQGYLFSDHIDITLLFWTELAVYFLSRAISPSPCTRGEGRGERSPGFSISDLQAAISEPSPPPSPCVQGERVRRLDLILCGVAQGLAFLSKWHLALFVMGLVIVAWLLPKTSLVGRDESRLSGGGVLIILVSAFITVAPWLIYIDIHFPHALLFINSFVLQHLSQNMSDWAGPWDRLLFDYNIQIFYVYYPAFLAAIVWAIVRAFQQKKMGLWLALAWAFGVFLPNVLAQTKTPSSTLIGWPACWLLLGCLVSAAFRGDRWAIGIWLISMLLAATLLTKSAIPQQTMGYQDYPYFGYIMVQHIWVVWYLLAALIGGWLIGYFVVTAPSTMPLSLLAAAAMLFLAVRWRAASPNPDAPPLGYINVAWRVTQTKYDQPDFSALGNFAQTLPPNAVFIVEDPSRSDVYLRSEAFLLQFASDHTCYPSPKDWRVMANELISVGAVPYLVTTQHQSLPPVFADATSGRTIYACSLASTQPAAMLWP